MGKRKTRESEPLFVNNTECLTFEHKAVDKLRKDLWLTTVKQKKLVKLHRDQIPDCVHADARCAIHDTPELLKHRID
jgi:hypothetical protein